MRQQQTIDENSTDYSWLGLSSRSFEGGAFRRSLRTYESYQKCLRGICFESPGLMKPTLMKPFESPGCLYTWRASADGAKAGGASIEAKAVKELEQEG